MKLRLTRAQALWPTTAAWLLANDREDLVMKVRVANVINLVSSGTAPAQTKDQVRWWSRGYCEQP